MLSFLQKKILYTGGGEVLSCDNIDNMISSWQGSYYIVAQILFFSVTLT